MFLWQQNVCKGQMLHLHHLSSCLHRLSEVLHCLLHPCRVLNQGQILLRQLCHQIKKLLGVSKVQLRLLQRGDTARWAGDASVST